MAKAPLFYLALLGLAGCFSPTSPTQRLAESAYDANTAARFGRMDVALEHVGGKAKESFTKQHTSWGKSVRVLDVEFGGMNLKNKGSEAEVFVTFTWQKLDEANIRTTSVTQRWVDTRGTWSLISEEEKGGDNGLLKEQAKAEAAPPLDRSRFQTRVIYEAPE